MEPDKVVIPGIHKEVPSRRHQNFDKLLDWPVGTVQIGMDKEPICIPGNAMLTMPGNTSKIEKVNHI